jgi:hypothetical protein
MTEQPQPASPADERPLWKLDRSEQRVLAITFVGGVPPIVVGASLIGLAIALGRILGNLAGWPLAILAISGLVAIMLFGPYLSLRKTEHGSNAFVVLAMLALIGQAAGIH